MMPPRAPARPEEKVDIVIKAQCLAGGRGKGKFLNGFQGGVHVVTHPGEAKKYAAKMLGESLVTKQTGPEGKPVNHVFLMERLYMRREMYVDELRGEEQSLFIYRFILWFRFDHSSVHRCHKLWRIVWECTDRVLYRPDTRHPTPYPVVTPSLTLRRVSLRRVVRRVVRRAEFHTISPISHMVSPFF
jgi:hypothetical protein